MAASVIVDASFLIALLSRRDTHHHWAVTQAKRFQPPWQTCEAALSEAFHLVGTPGAPALVDLLRRRAVTIAFDIGDDLERVLRLLEKYGDVPASIADVSLVRMTETLTEPIVVTTDSDFRVYKRHGRQAIPCVTPAK